MTLTSIQLDEIINKYCERIVDEMDTNTMAHVLYDMLVDSFQCHNEHDMEEQICAIYNEDYWQELVESVTVE